VPPFGMLPAWRPCGLRSGPFRATRGVLWPQRRQRRLAAPAAASVAQEFWDGRTEKVDWRESWVVTEVSPEEWEDLRHRLELEYRKVAERIRANDHWDSDRIGKPYEG
jgi:hypothetical protein